MLAEEFFARLASGTLAMGTPATHLRRFDLESVLTLANRKDQPRGVIVSDVRWRARDCASLHSPHARVARERDVPMPSPIERCQSTARPGRR